MKKKYTMEELKEMFDKAVSETIEELEKELEEAQKKLNKQMNPAGRMAYTMQNLMVMGTLRNRIFKEEK